MKRHYEELHRKKYLEFRNPIEVIKGLHTRHRTLMRGIPFFNCMKLNRIRSEQLVSISSIQKALEEINKYEAERVTK